MSSRMRRLARRLSTCAVCRRTIPRDDRPESLSGSERAVCQECQKLVASEGSQGVQYPPEAPVSPPEASLAQPSAPGGVQAVLEEPGSQP
jgi:hypothetical protein